MSDFNYNNHILLWDDHSNEHITVAKYNEWVRQRDRNSIADLIVDRLLRRYIKPFEFDDAQFKKAYKNGFVMMASYCLLIETIEGFYRGWEKSRNELAFLKFFTRDPNFSEFATDDLPTRFYRGIRCGVLHQGETVDGWLITRKHEYPLLSRNPFRVNATLFGELLKKSLNEYRALLKSSDWDGEIWKNAKTRMKVAISNCSTA